MNTKLILPLASFLLITCYFLNGHAQEAIDFMKIQGNDGPEYLRIISVQDAISEGNGVLKIQVESSKTGAADLVPTSDPMASGFRIETTYGTRSWRKERFYSMCYGGTDADVFYSILPSGDGASIMCGSTNSYGAGSSDFLLLKTDDEGSIDWAKAYGYASSNSGYAIAPTSVGGYLLTGYSWNPTYNSSYAYIYHVDGSGSTLLEGGLGTQNDGQKGNDGIQSADDNFVVVGSSSGASTNYFRDVYVKKINSTSGANIWGWTYGVSGHDEGNAIKQRSDGGYVLVGVSAYLNDDSDILFMLLDSDGTGELTLHIGGDEFEEAEDVIILSDGNYLLGGVTESYGAGGLDFYLRKQDTDGDPLWSSTIGGSLDDRAQSLIEANDGGILVIGETKSFGEGDYDAWLIKTDNSGNPLWSWVFGGVDDDYGYDLYQDVSGCIYACGHTENYGSGNRDALIIKFSADGTTCLGSSVGFASDNADGTGNLKGFRFRKVDNVGSLTNHLPSISLDLEGQDSKGDVIIFSNSGKNESSITPDETIICN